MKQGEASLGETPGVGETDLGRGDHLGELDAMADLNGSYFCM